jgi:hypothetical protein
MPMNVDSNGALKVEALLRAFPDVTVATPINQGATDAFGEGVCRGVVQGYIFSYLNSIWLHNPGLLLDFQGKLASMHYGKNGTQFLALHGDWKHHTGTFANTADLARAMSLGSSTAGTIQNRDADPAALFGNLAQSFRADGVYFIALQGHAVCLVKRPPEFRFLDPNTAEFVSKDSASFQGFMASYYDQVFRGTEMADPVGYTIHYPLRPPTPAPSPPGRISPGGSRP